MPFGEVNISWISVLQDNKKFLLVTVYIYYSIFTSTFSVKSSISIQPSASRYPTFFVNNLENLHIYIFILLQAGSWLPSLYSCYFLLTISASKVYCTILFATKMVPTIKNVTVKSLHFCEINCTLCIRVG